MSIILNNTILNQLSFSKDLCIFKYSNKNNFKNYFFSPNISIKLYNAKVTWVDNNNVSFGFKKYATIDKENNTIVHNDNISLLNLLRNINNTLLKIYHDYKENYGHDILLNKDNSEILPNLFYEKETEFYIKCNLPNKNGKFFIKTQNDTGSFSKPRVGTEYTSVTLDIRNIWEMNDKVGFRLELKETFI